VFVCSSGGLDSTGIAALVRGHFRDVTLVSFDLASPRGRPSADRVAARRVATELRMPLYEVDWSVPMLIELMDFVLLEGIDWRSFNVHAAVVNAALARAIHDETRGDRRTPLVFTGDLANEFLADYAEESFGGIVQYRLPHVAPGQLRSALIGGLDTSHREVGVFSALGLCIVQPYAVAVDAYLSIPPDFLGSRNSKQRLGSAIFGSLVPGFVLERQKVRAQTGGPDGGVMAALLGNGIDEAWLARRFADLHATESALLNRFIRAGRYVSAVPSRSGEILHAAS
jgi:asparagine synthetase B (glutamine-hydrolysing)